MLNEGGGRGGGSKCVTYLAVSLASDSESALLDLLQLQIVDRVTIFFVQSLHPFPQSLTGVG